VRIGGEHKENAHRLLIFHIPSVGSLQGWSKACRPASQPGPSKYYSQPGVRPKTSIAPLSCAYYFFSLFACSHGLHRGKTGSCHSGTCLSCDKNMAGMTYGRPVLSNDWQLLYWPGQWMVGALRPRIQVDPLEMWWQTSKRVLRNHSRRYW